jgi:putative membrane protein
VLSVRVLAHAGPWNLDPLLLTGIALAAVLYGRGRRSGHGWRAVAFAGALAALVGALASPLDALAADLASAHMVQHVLLVLAAAPLLALSAPTGALLRGGPHVLRNTVRWSHRVAPWRDRLQPYRHPVALWLAHVATLWFWHASVPYGAALAHEPVHIVEHASFLITGVLFWSVVIGGPRVRRVPEGYAILLVFAMALQSVFLSALLTFARRPWYDAYATTTAAYGLDPLTDQHLAGAIMWVPAGLVYLAAGLGLTVAWLREAERGADDVGPYAPSAPPSAASRRS